MWGLENGTVIESTGHVTQQKELSHKSPRQRDMTFTGADALQLSILES